MHVEIQREGVRGRAEGRRRRVEKKGRKGKKEKKENRKGLHIVVDCIAYT